MSQFDIDLGSWMAGMREHAGLSQEALAAQLGTEQPTISKIERGQRRVSVEDLLHWSAALDLGLETLSAELARLADRHLSTRSLWQR